MSAFLSQLASAVLVLILLCVSGATFFFMLSRLTPYERPTQRDTKTVVRRHTDKTTP